MPVAKSYLERYHAGDRIAVWDELIGLGAQVRVRPLLDDALAVARESVRRARHNVELIYRRLVDLGYQFANPIVYPKI
jgi:hypothetical protein